MISRGRMINILLGVTIALLPLYTRISQLDFNRTSKDNLLVIIFGVLCFLMPERKRSLPTSLLLGLLYCAIGLAFNQWNIISVNVIVLTFYALSGILFFANYYERHTREGIAHILTGMKAGALIQAILIFFNYFGMNIYFDFVCWITGSSYYSINIDRTDNLVGSLGNTNLIASYLALTSLAFLESKNRKWLIVIPIAATVLTRSTMGIGSLAAGILYYLNNQTRLFSKLEIFLISSVAMFFAFFMGVVGADSGRFEGWSRNFELVTVKHFFFGMGAGWFPDKRILILKEALLGSEHNAFLTAFNVFGIAIFLFLIPSIYRFIMKEDKKPVFSAILFAAFINSYGHFTLNQSTVAIIIIVAACICLGDKDNVNNMERERVTD